MKCVVWTEKAAPQGTFEMGYPRRAIPLEWVTTQVLNARGMALVIGGLIIAGQNSAVKYLCQSVPGQHSLFLFG
jgi:hypothetical protein